MKPDPDRDNSAFSVMEELEPPPPQSGAGRWWQVSQVRDLVLGLLVLSGVLGWAGYTWWRDTTNRTTYAQAQQEASLKHWDEALAQYSAVKGYKDSDARAADASKQITERDNLYKQIVPPGRLRTAERLLLAARAVQAIQPGYRDVDRIAASAEDQVYTDALSGTIVMRTSAHPPGLYYRGPAGWKYLQNSDASSSVLSVPFRTKSANSVVYDVAGPGRTYPLPAATPPYDPYASLRPLGAPNLSGRRLVRVTLPAGAGEPQFHNLRMDPSEYNFYICGDEGVWGVLYVPGATSRVVTRGILNGFSVTYESAIGNGNNVLTPARIPGAEGVVADFAHSSDRLLLASHDYAGESPVTNLYLAGADGSGPRMVFSTTDTLLGALLSPDDQHALIVTSKQSDGQVEVTARLLGMESSTLPVVLKQLVLSGTSKPDEQAVPNAGGLAISGVFLESGAFRDKLLLGWRHTTKEDRAGLELLNVYHPETSLFTTSVPYAGTGAVSVVEQPDGETLLLYNLAAPLATAQGNRVTTGLQTLHLQAATGQVTTGSYTVPLPGAESNTESLSNFASPTLRGDDIIYRVDSYLYGREIFNAYSLEMADAESHRPQVAEPMHIFGGEWTGNQGRSSAGPPVGVAGPGAYGYTDSKGTLHAHLYGSQVDVLLESGVGTLFALDTDYFYKVLH